MKASKIILYIVIAAAIIYLIYKAYTNYQISGNVFRSSGIDPSTGLPSSFNMEPCGRMSQGVSTRYYIYNNEYYETSSVKDMIGTNLTKISKDDYISAYNNSKIPCLE